MKLLFDQNLSFRLCSILQGHFPHSSQVRLLNLERATDFEIWQYAQDEGFVIVTLDADFYDIGLLHGAPPKIIWLRCGNQPTLAIAELLRKHFDTIHESLKDDSLACLELY